MGSREDAEISMKSAERAVELDPSNSDARVALGSVKWQPYLDWQGAEWEFRLAVALDPNNANAHDGLGGMLSEIGRLDEGLRDSQRAQELDPNQDHLSDALWRRRDYEGSLAILRMMINRHPNDGYLHLSLFQSYSQMGIHKEAIEELQKFLRLFGFAEVAAHVQRAYSVFGYQGALRQCAQETEQLQAAKRIFVPGYLAELYAMLGDKDRAFYWLREGYEHRDRIAVDGGVSLVKTDPLLDPLRSDPRYKDLLRRAGLPE
jgi:tetratricopeptide (TPR) repeat protein